MMRSFKYIILIAIVAMAAGCGRKGSVPLEPSEVVEEFVKAVASGRTDDALKLCDNTRMAGYIETYMEALKKGRDRQHACIYCNRLIVGD